MSEDKDPDLSVKVKNEEPEEALREKEEAKKRAMERLKYVTKQRRRPRNAPSQFRD